MLGKVPDLWNINLFDTHLDLLHTDIPSKHFVCLQDVLTTSSRHVLKISSRHVFKTSWRRLEDAFSVKMFGLLRRLQDALRDVFKTSSRRLGRWKIVTLKTCWRPTNVCWNNWSNYISFSVKSIFQFLNMLLLFRYLIKSVFWSSDHLIPFMDFSFRFSFLLL